MRSSRTSLALSLMVITAVAALIFLAALSVGVEDAMLRNTVGLFSGHISADGLPATVQPADLMRPGVVGVLKRELLPGRITTGGRSLPLALCGVEPSREMELTALPRKITSGRYPRAGAPEVLMGAGAAATLGAAVGDTVRFSSPTAGVSIGLAVVGCYATGMEALDRAVAFAPLDLLPSPGAWSAAVFLATGVDAEAVLADYRRHFPRSVTFTSWETRMPDLRQLIDLEAVSMAIVIVLVFAVVAIGIACAFVIVIVRNLREYGILKTMGTSNREIAGLIAAKVILLNAVACTAGLLIGILTVWGVATGGGIDIGAFTSHNQYFAVSGVIVPRLTIFSLWAPPATALAFSLLAAVWPAVLVTRKRAADILRVV
jgi:ABC-type lipoprotein release transport system permease subunit